MISPSARDGVQMPFSKAKVFRENYEKNNQLKWQYFGTEDGLLVVYPGNVVESCDEYDPRYRY